MSKRNIEPIIVRRGNGWHITYNRKDRDYAAFADNGTLILIGFFVSQTEAETAAQAYAYCEAK